MTSPLMDEQAHEVHFGVVRADGGGDVLEDGGLARLRGADDQSALALADGRHEVDDAGGDGVLAVLHDEAFVRVDRREVAEAHAAAQLLDGRAVDGRDLLDGGVLLVLARRARLTGHEIALAQAVAADGGKTHVAIRLAGQVALRAEEAVAVGQDVQDAGHLDEALGLDTGFEHGLHQLGLLEARHVEVELGGLLAQLGHLELRQLLARHAGLHFAVAAVVVVLATLTTLVLAVVLPVLAAALLLAIAAAVVLLAGVRGVLAAVVRTALRLLLLRAARLHRFARRARGRRVAARSGCALGLALRLRLHAGGTSLDGSGRRSLRGCFGFAHAC